MLPALVTMLFDLALNHAGAQMQSSLAGGGASELRTVNRTVTAGIARCQTAMRFRNEDRVVELKTVLKPPDWCGVEQSQVPQDRRHSCVQ
jgi:hypothetical protein